MPEEVRHKLVVLFDIPRSGRTVVEYRAAGAVVTSDGFTPTDIEAITLEKMQGLLGSESDNFYKLFEEVADHLDQLLDGSLGKIDKTDETETPAKRFCDSCDSKGVRHKKACPKNKHD